MKKILKFLLQRSLWYATLLVNFFSATVTIIGIVLVLIISKWIEKHWP